MAFVFPLGILSKVLIIPVVKEKIKVKLALAIPIGALITVVKEIVDLPPHVADKAIKKFLKFSRS